MTVVSFVFEKWHPVKNGRADMFQYLQSRDTQDTSNISKTFRLDYRHADS
jgi:hypothetical protein